MGGITSMEDLILILVLSGIGLVTLLVSVWLFYRKKRKTDIPVVFIIRRKLI